MAAIEEALALIETRGAQLNRDDERDIEALLASLPLDEVHEVRPWVREAIWLVVAAPDYAGDIVIAD